MIAENGFRLGFCSDDHVDGIRSAGDNRKDHDSVGMLYESQWIGLCCRLSSFVNCCSYRFAEDIFSCLLRYALLNRSRLCWYFVHQIKTLGVLSLVAIADWREGLRGLAEVPVAHLLMRIGSNYPIMDW